MSQKSWKSKDNIEIPLWGTPERKEYEGAFKQRLDAVFGGLHNTLRKLKVPLAQINEHSGNEPVNKDRLNLYTRMARGGDRLPPVVVRRNPNDTFDMIDGSHRRAAAHAAGLKGLDAYELVPKLASPAVKKSLKKMAIADIPPGEEDGADYNGQRWNYSHVLPEAHHGIYRVQVRHGANKVDIEGKKADALSAILSHKTSQGWRHAGMVAAEFHPNKKQLVMDTSDVQEQHRGRGLGLALYEALYAHARNVLGAKRVAGGEHSSMAASVHAKLSRKHGLGYVAKPSGQGDPEEEGAYDDAYKPYEYALKSEEEGDTSFDFGANAAPQKPAELPPLHVAALKSIKRMKGPKRDLAHAWFQYTQGHITERPPVTPDLERHLARFGIVDPQGYSFDANGRSMSRPLPGKKKNGPVGKQPDSLRQYRQNSTRWGYYTRYQRSEEELEDFLAKAFPDWKPPAIAPMTPPAPKKVEVPGLQAPPAAMKSPMHSTVEGFMGQLKTLPKGSPERGKLITSHMNHGPFLAALQTHPQGPAMHKQLTSYLNGAGNAGFKAGGTKVVAKSEKPPTISIPYTHRVSSLKTPKMGEQFHQHIEPAGEYMMPRDSDRTEGLETERGDTKDKSLGKQWFEHGIVHFHNPLMVHHTFADPWKPKVSAMFGGKKGPRLTQAILAAGHDGIVAQDPKSGRHVEVVNLGGRKDVTHPLAADAALHGKGGIKKAEGDGEPAFEMPLTDLHVGHDGLLEALSNVTRDRGSRSSGPLSVWVNEKGENLLVDGHHRLAAHLLSGRHNGKVPVKVVGRGYTDYWATPRQKAHLDPQTKYGGLESMASEEILDEAAPQHAAPMNHPTKAIIKAEDARRLPPAEQKKLRKALRMNKAKRAKLRKSSANLRQSPPDTLESRHEVASAMLGFKPHMHAAFRAARFLMGGEPATIEQMRRVLWDHDGDATAAAMDLYGMPDNEASRKALAGHQSVADLDKAEGAPPEPKHALAVVPASVRAAAALSRAFAEGSFQSVKLNGKHSTGSMLASDPDSGLTFLLKPNAGGISPAKGVGEETASQARREAAFWHASRLFGLEHYMPQADVVSIAMSDGSTHEWAAILMLPPDWKPVEEVRETNLNWLVRCLEKYRADGTLHQWGALDYILGNPDRHWGNALIRDTDIKLIDQGSALAGKDFAPGTDKNSFVPFYLRYTCPTSKFNKLAIESKLRWMPSVSKDVDEMLRVWVHGIDPLVLAAVLRTYGIHPDACVERLKRLQAITGSMSQAINRSWAAS